MLAEQPSSVLSALEVLGMNLEDPPRTNAVHTGYSHAAGISPSRHTRALAWYSPTPWMSLWNTQFMSALEYAFSALEMLPHRFRTKNAWGTALPFEVQEAKAQGNASSKFFCVLVFPEFRQRSKAESTIGKAEKFVTLVTIVSPLYCSKFAFQYFPFILTQLQENDVYF